jgi:predicted secreted protein
MADVNNVAQQSFADTAAKIQAETARRNAQVDQDRRAKVESDAAASSAKAEAEKAKALAWAQFYTAPKECEHPPDWNIQVECGNKFMRAKRAVEAQYSGAAPPSRKATPAL